MPKLLSLILVISIVILSSCASSTKYRNSITDEITLKNFSLNPRNKTSMVLTVAFMPNKRTVPEKVYSVTIFCKSSVLDSSSVMWSSEVFAKSSLGTYNFESLDNAKRKDIVLPLDNDIVKAYIETTTKPVSQRNFNLADYAYVVVK